MKKYIYTGTEDQLIECGFEKTKNQKPLNYTKMLDEVTGTELVIFMESDWYEEMVIYYNASTDEILEEHIEDLIAKGLVKEVEVE